MHPSYTMPGGEGRMTRGGREMGEIGGLLRAVSRAVAGG
jgi:hypothetical protein